MKKALKVQQRDDVTGHFNEAECIVGLMTASEVFFLVFSFFIRFVLLFFLCFPFAIFNMSYAAGVFPFFIAHFLASCSFFFLCSFFMMPYRIRLRNYCQQSG